MNFLQEFLPFLNILLLVAMTVGGILALKKGYSKETGEIQERVINALKEELSVLHSKVDDLEQERATQDRVIATIRYALKQYGLKITISGDYVTLHDTSGKNTSVRVQPAKRPLDMEI